MNIKKTRVGCVQFEPIIGEVDSNINKILHHIKVAHDKGIEILVLPELSNSGYVFHSREEAFNLAEMVPDGATTLMLIEAASKHKMIIVAGIAEVHNGVLYNSAVAVGHNGYIGKFRKNHLWGAENLFFEPGNLGVPVWHTPHGRISALICYDAWFPEVFRMAAIQGADLICIPTNWVPMPEQPDGLPLMSNILIMSAAHSNSFFIAAADRIGTERQQPFLGSSIITASNGWPVAGPASKDKEELIFADINLSDARSKRSFNSFNQPLRDRRIDLYDEYVGADIKRSWY